MLHGELNPLAPPRRLQILIIAFLVRKLGYAGETYPSDLANGEKITGAIEHSNFLPHRETPDAKHFASLKTGVMGRNARILRSLAGTKNPARRTERLELPFPEREKGGIPNRYHRLSMT